MEKPISTKVNNFLSSAKISVKSCKVIQIQQTVRQHELNILIRIFSYNIQFSNKKQIDCYISMMHTKNNNEMHTAAILDQKGQQRWLPRLRSHFHQLHLHPSYRLHLPKTNYLDFDFVLGEIFLKPVKQSVSLLTMKNSLSKMKRLYKKIFQLSWKFTYRVCKECF